MKKKTKQENNTDQKSPRDIREEESHEERGQKGGESKQEEEILEEYEGFYVENDGAGEP